MPGILWLASYPKSGNTWMRAFLANLILDASAPLPLKRIGEVCPSEPAEMWFKPFTKGPVGDLTAKEVAELRSQAQERAVSLNNNVVPMKTHSYFGEDCGHPIFSMKATFGAVYIIRDPRDVAVSAADHFGKTMDEMIATMADPLATGMPMPGIIVHELQSSWSNHVESWTKWNHPGIFVVRYEDLLADPAGHLREIFAWMDIDPSAELCDRVAEETRIGKLQQASTAGTAWDLEKEPQGFFRKGKADAWKEDLSAREIAVVEAIAGPLMDELGYRRETPGMSWRQAFEIRAREGLARRLASLAVKLQ